MVADGGERPAPHPSPVTLCLGSEREGITAPVLKDCSKSWTIPLRKAGPESLNVAAAAAIACERISSPSAGPESS
jgi:tRNA G18 (ribose-2'-O)-methylase SpoU